ncbi:AAA-like domain-containing protein [Kovacikia minuta CCNUW1]|uniref:AAA-like domain-containing protein n=1 Tax=Kovacikia minuta TaxID=2931930 RepID=UPI001CC9D073|nr:AAA-like domain-containing protein [Kovacikia minuta]UBF29271.1 AAA-like domain-containing protein [Kovacikia minuta CCNUW1]
MSDSQAIEVFFSYSHRDEALRDELAKHLSIMKRQGVIKAWHDRQITAGSEWAGDIDAHLNSAQVILLLISADFLASDYCYDIELTQAMVRHEAREACVIPIILKPVDWHGAPFGKLQALPKNAQPITTWANTDEAFLNVAQGIRKAVEAVLQTSKPDAEEEKTQSSLVVSLEEPDGAVPLGSQFYMERSPIDADCYERLVRPGALIRIKAPGQMGKTSLISRVLDSAKQQGYRTAAVNFRSIDAEFWSSLDQFLQWFCASVTEAMERPDKLADYWKGILGAKNKSIRYFERYLLAESDMPLVLGLDNADEIFAHEEIARDFFGLLRTWHEQGKNEDAWKKLRLVIAHSKEVYIPLNMDQSPFNVGFATELRELRRVEVQDLIQRHGLQWGEEPMEQLMQLVGGHPYLLRVALYQIARQRMTLTELLEVAPTEGGLYGEHLRHHYLNLKSDHKLVTALRQVVSTDQPVQVGTEEAFRLQSMGLVKYQGNAVVPLCGLYRRYFGDLLNRG